MKRIGIDDFTYYNYPTCMVSSPDGAHAALAVVNANVKDNRYDSCLWIYTMADGSVRKLTGGKKERNFIWLDVKTLLFTSDLEKSYAEKVKKYLRWHYFTEREFCSILFIIFMYENIYKKLHFMLKFKKIPLV